MGFVQVCLETGTAKMPDDVGIKAEQNLGSLQRFSVAVAMRSCFSWVYLCLYLVKPSLSPIVLAVEN